MAQKKKTGTGTPVKKKRAGISWQNNSRKGSSKLAAAIALVGVVAILVGYLLQDSALLALNKTNAAQESTVRISEFQSENVTSLISETGDVPDWIEITNTGSAPVEVGKYSLVLKSNINQMFSFPDYTLAPGEYLLIHANGTVSGARNQWGAPFKLPASGGDTLVLLNAQGRTIDAVDLPELGEDASYSWMGDEGWLVTAATPGKKNQRAAAQEGAEAVRVNVQPGQVELSEVMASNPAYFPDENGECHDYVELHNTTASDINLGGWYLSDSSDKLKRWAFPSVTLPAGGYLAVHCSGYNRSDDPAHLHTDFKIGSDGEQIYLSRPDGQTVSMIDGVPLVSGQAYSLENGAWSTDIAPTPGMPNTAQAAGQVNAATFGDRSAQLCISEIMASPSTEEYDWIELYNGSGQVIDLSNYGISDDASRPRKWQFPAGTSIQPGEYKGIFLSGTALSSIGGVINADFSLASEGGYTVSLSDPEGRILDAAYLGRQYGGISYGRQQNQYGFYFFETGTPGTANGGACYADRAPEPVASVMGGLYTTGESFTVELSGPVGGRIYYTLDCTDPSESSMLYTGPIQVSGTTILRSRVYMDGYMPSITDTQSYLYDVNNEGSVVVVSLVSDPDNLYSNDRGIMVKGPNAWPDPPYGSINNGANFWMDWEREAHVELFEPDGDMAISQGCGIKLHGQYSRQQDVKAFKIFARSEYGTSRFEYPIFSNRDYDEYQSFLLRVSGQDFDKTFMRDSVLSALADTTSVMFQETEVGICYLNGEYYSLVNLRERVSRYSICQFEDWYGMEEDIDLIKANDIEKLGSNESMEALLAWIKANDVTTQAAYDYIAAHIDIQNYMEYMAIEIFVGNGDTLNVKRYRNAKTDGKWRWVLYDLDWGFYVDTNSIRRWLDPEGMGSNKYTDTRLFIACMKNPIFYEQFMVYFGQQMATTFTTENVMARFQERYEIIDGLLPQYQQRWGIKQSDMESEMRRLVSYAKTRPTKIIGYFQETFKLSNAEMERYFGDAIREIRAYESKTATAN